MTATNKKIEHIERAHFAPVAAAQNDLERQLAERTEELAAARREIEAVASAVSHDLRAPLRLIHAHAQMLREDVTTAASRDSEMHVEQIQRGARCLSALIDAILTYSRLGQVELKRERVSLAELMQNVIAELKPAREVEWRIGELPVAMADPGLIVQSLSILLQNAIKYAARERCTRIEIGADADGAVFIRDNGVGFDMRYAGKLFGMFQRLHRQDEFEGVGVGLALARRIIERHGGRIWADAKVGEGATFRFTLPLAT
jgi:light-regulated signal transduction histidine kinase (bacteriophytochrome)